MTREQMLALIFEQVHTLQSIGKPRRGQAPCRRGTYPRSRCTKKWHHGRSMAIPKQITFVTFDVYGTLIDWETGAADAFMKEAERDGFTLDPAEIIPLFHSVQQQIQAGSYELYAEVLRRTAVQIAKDLGWPLEPRAPGSCPTRCNAGRPSRRPTRSSQRSQEVQHRADLEYRRQAPRPDAPAYPARLRPGRHRSAGPLLQA